jgi:hypothetical protein
LNCCKRLIFKFNEEGHHFADRDTTNFLKFL